MPEDGTRECIHGEDDDHSTFMRGAMNVATMHGACVLEYFTCPDCHRQQMCSHSWQHAVPCGNCGTMVKSKIAPLPEPGSVTKEGLLDAIRMVRQAIPECPTQTQEWLEKNQGALRAACVAYGCGEIHRALNMVEAIARRLSGGHG